MTFLATYRATDFVSPVPILDSNRSRTHLTSFSNGAFVPVGLFRLHSALKYRSSCVVLHCKGSWGVGQWGPRRCTHSGERVILASR